MDEKTAREARAAKLLSEPSSYYARNYNRHIIPGLASAQRTGTREFAECNLDDKTPRAFIVSGVKKIVRGHSGDTGSLWKDCSSLRMLIASLFPTAENSGACGPMLARWAYGSCATKVTR